jgi:hypothetical protein
MYIRDNDCDLFDELSFITILSILSRVIDNIRMLEVICTKKSMFDA